MSRVHDAVRAGDALRIDGTVYEAAGRMVLRTPDGSHWSEWLLVPVDSTPALALKEQTHRWLCLDEEALSLWRPEPLPPGLQPEALSHGDERVIDGQRYRVVERDSARVDSVQGDVGGEANIGAAFEYAELRSGQRKLSLEWDARGAAMTRGRTIGDHDLVAWSRAADGALAQRSGGPLTKVRRGRAAHVATAGSQRSDTGLTLFAGVGIAMLFALSLTRCKGDCQARIHPVTGQQERVCDDDGIRSRSGGRSYGGWNGK